ncbi:hypothetical protein JHK86_018905 [Glycine max]|nr:hypothetical protein JHK86_018905 [Glycine max]
MITAGLKELTSILFLSSLSSRWVNKSGVEIGSRRDEAPAINNTNVFVVLGSLKKKKDQRGPSKPNDKKDIFWAPAPLTSKSWADVDDEDDNDYYATIAPPESVWVAPIVTLNDAAAAEVGPQAIYVVGRDNDESIAAGSEISDAASWETVNDDEMEALTNYLRNFSAGLLPKKTKPLSLVSLCVGVLGRHLEDIIADLSEIAINLPADIKITVAAIARRRKLLNDDVLIALADTSWEIFDVSGSDVSDFGLIKAAERIRSSIRVFVIYGSPVIYSD